MQHLHRIGWLSLAMALSLSAIVTTAGIAKPFTYVNARFGQSCTFPDEIFDKPMPEPENGDGQQWLSADRASLTCSGIYNVDNDTPQGFVAQEKASTEPGYKITYSKTGKNWAAFRHQGRQDLLQAAPVREGRRHTYRLDRVSRRAQG
ncbi:MULTISPECIES: hypothetical protein [unclassified Mesorhizobium]|uniref:hypothetical protein n=1 Tax=unclassified Mesorhizobium TaxID=325217 RepID=UPI001FF0056C|nr:MULTISPECIES: hypothetical protein [unclassified Mesorhizobium]